MPGPQYTKCVLPQAYKDYQITPEIILIVGAIFTALMTGNIPATIIALGAGISLFHEVVNYMLNGKLICLPNGEEICVVGTVANIEEVGQDKNLFAAIDNDYSINLILQPFDLEVFLGKHPHEVLEIARKGTQGVFLSEPVGIPLNDEGKPRYGGYFSTWIQNHHTDKYVVYEGEYESEEISEWVKDHPEVFGKNFNYSPYHIPVLHCECEGSRIRDVLDALESYPGGGGKFCKKNFFTRFLCKVLATLFAPYIVGKLIYNWLAASGGDPGAARLDPGSGEIEIGDTLLIKGRWVYDAGHSGYNEVHAVKTIQKVLPNYAGLQFPPQVFDLLYSRWCGLVGQVALVSGVGIPGDTPTTPPDGTPPDKPPSVKPKPKGMTPAQEEIYDRQRRPEHRWQFHPVLDGCEPFVGKP